jgi:hypothetical protein
MWELLVERILVERMPRLCKAVIKAKVATMKNLKYCNVGAVSRKQVQRKHFNKTTKPRH